MSETIVGLCFALALVLFVMLVCASWYVLQRLRTRHSAKWVELGSPTLVANNSLKNSLTVRRFLRSEEFRQLDDPRLILMVSFQRWAGRLYVILLIILLGDFFSTGR